MSSRSTEPTVRDRLEERPTLEPGKMREARPRELITRFAAGGLTSMVAGAATLALGARIGGVFLAFPAILAASLTLIEEQDICAGLKAYGLSRDALRIASAMLDIATRSRDLRLAELYCGFDRTETSEIVSYPVACRPQAWAAVAPFMLLQATLGVNASAPDATLRIITPTLPPALARIELRDLRVGEASVDLAFTRSREATEFTLLEQRGELSVHGAAVPN